MTDSIQKIQKNDNMKKKRIKNNLPTKIYYNQIINNFDLNNIIPNQSSLINSSNNYKTENNSHKISSISLNSLTQQRLKETHPYHIILLLYKELISITNDSNSNVYLNEYKKIIHMLNNNNVSFESIKTIFKTTFLKIIEEKVKTLKDNIKQYQSSIILLEQSKRYYLQLNFLKQTKIDILESEIDSYLEMEEEFDEMKEKLKYERGKFLHNEKKENEILILRAENSNLKKVIDKNEKTIEEKEHIIQSYKKKSASLKNTNKNTMKNSFDLNEHINNNHYSLVIKKKSRFRAKQKFSHNNSNITNFNRISSPINIENYKTNNNYCSNKSFYIKKRLGEITKSNIKADRKSAKHLINSKIKNKVLNMKKIRRINDNCLDSYNKSTSRVNNSLLSNNSNNSKNKRIRKSINSYFKSNKNNFTFRINNTHKKLISGLTNANINNKQFMNELSKKNYESNKIIINSILENEEKNTSKIKNNKSFLLKSSERKICVDKNNNKNKTNLKNNRKDFLLERNNYSLLKTPSCFNSNDIENNSGIKNGIIINNIFQNSTGVPIPGTSREKNKKENSNILECEQNLNKKKMNNNKSSKFLSVNIKNKK